MSFCTQFCFEVKPIFSALTYAERCKQNVTAGSSKASLAISRTQDQIPPAMGFTTKNSRRPGGDQHSARREREQGLWNAGYLAEMRDSRRRENTRWVSEKTSWQREQRNWRMASPGKDGKLPHSQHWESDRAKRQQLCCWKKHGTKEDELDNPKGLSLWTHFDFSNLILQGCRKCCRRCFALSF